MDTKTSDSNSQSTTSSNTSPKIAVYSQYLADISFENPRMLEINPSDGPPEVEISLDVQNQPFEEQKGVFVVSLYINAKTLQKGKILFNLELTYNGIFGVEDFAAEIRDMILGVHCPPLIFPFARRIIATTTQDGGFQPLMLDPVDFGLLYQRKLQAANNAS